MSYYRYGADDTPASQPAGVTPDNVGDYFPGKITWDAAEAVCKTVSKEFDGEDCVAPGSPGTQTQMDKEVAKDTKTDIFIFGGLAALVLWFVFR